MVGDRQATVTHVEMSTDTGRRIGVQINLTLAPNYELVYGDHPLASDLPQEVCEALRKWLEET